MSWNSPDDERWEEPDRPADDDARELGDWPAEEDIEDDELLTRHSGRWPLDPRDLYPRERWLWYEQLWSDACMLRDRYRLGLRSEWWEDAVQVEAIAAFAAWVDRYDTGEWDDPPGKLNLLYDLDRLNALLRDGLEPFSAARDRGPFLRYIIAAGAQPPPRVDGLG